jgi:hypothetical protein
MSYDADHFESPVHPVRVYGAGDLAIAYTGAQDHVTSRALCWPEHKVYGRIYGDEARLTGALERLGYAEAGSRDFDGARLLKIEADYGRYVGPYMDGSYGADVKPDCLVMSYHCDLDGQNENGFLGTEATCDRCGDSMDPEYATTVGDVQWCEGCYSQHAIYCEACCESVDVEYATEVEGTWYCDSCASDNSFACNKCGDRFFTENHNEVSGEDWCPSCSDRHAFHCDHCEASHDADFISQESVNGETWCEDCVRDGATECEKCEHYTVSTSVINGRCEDCAAEADTEESTPALHGSVAA